MKNFRYFAKLTSLCGVLSLTIATAAMAAEVEAKKDVEIYADATNKSDVLGKLKTGEALKAGERKGMFWQVTTKDGKAGFISVLSVNHKADAGGGSDLAKAVKNVVSKGATPTPRRKGPLGGHGRARLG